MNAERLLAHYDRIVDAPDAIPRLRRFVFDLAVRGKLVPQEPDEKPAPELLSEIDLKRAKLVQAGIVRPAKKIAATRRTNELFDVPPGWAWTNANRLWDFENGDRSKNYPSKDQLVSQGIPFINAGHLQNGQVSMRDMNFITAAKFEQLGGGKLRRGDQLYCLRGSLGKHATFLHDGEAAIASSLVILRPIEAETVPYLSRYLDSDIALIMLKRFDNGTAQPNLSSANLRLYEIPLPPLSEQRRIVAKVNELMSLCDRLEAARTKREATRDQFTAASLARLDMPDADTFPDDARFALNTLPALTARYDQVKQLRETILNLGIRGKLVPQDPREEPASELLKRIAAEKARLGVKHVILPLRPEAVSFDLPNGWNWSRVGELCSKTGSGSTPRGGKEVYKDAGVPFLRSQNVHDDGLRLNDVAYIDPDTHARMAGTRVLPGDLLLNITGGSIGRCCRVPDDFEEANVSQHVAIIRAAVKGIENFLHRLVLSPYFQAFILNEQTGAGRGGLPKNRMDKIAVALPPLAEQFRIVAKVDELMSLCDRLEASLSSAEESRSRLLDALLAEALEPKDERELEAAE
jgi:type I restriction enzyme S subunit